MEMKFLSQAEIDKLVVVERNPQPRKVLWGIGNLDADFNITDRYTDKRYIWQYFLWQALVKNCCSPFFKQGKNSVSIRNRYTICEEWLSFSNFFEWLNKEVDYGGNNPDFYLNCQVLNSDCLHYSPDTTFFLPKEISNLLYKSHVKYDIDLPTGVRNHRGNSGGYYCTISVGDRYTNPRFDTPEEAFLAYKTAKESQIKVVANQYRDVLKPAVYESLMNWEIEP